MAQTPGVGVAPSGMVWPYFEGTDADTAMLRADTLQPAPSRVSLVGLPIAACQPRSWRVYDDNPRGLHDAGMARIVRVGRSRRRAAVRETGSSAPSAPSGPVSVPRQKPRREPTLRGVEDRGTTAGATDFGSRSHHDERCERDQAIDSDAVATAMRAPRTSNGFGGKPKGRALRLLPTTRATT
jgi:hypothetical protein